uniref:Uncharacterized protein MANES_06G116800 n=1 Tax=Rhizophora mucronata TaxID=61149 RepID=A0A2P2J6N8_RHIMU
MKTFHTFQQLQHQAFNLTCTKRLLHCLHQPLEVMFHVLHHHKNTIKVIHNNFLYIHNRRMMKRQKNINFPQRCQRETPFF